MKVKALFFSHLLRQGLLFRQSPIVKKVDYKDKYKYKETGEYHIMVKVWMYRNDTNNVMEVEVE
jgi:hypothetical protein